MPINAEIVDQLIRLLDYLVQKNLGFGAESTNQLINVSTFAGHISLRVSPVNNGTRKNS